MPWRRSLWLCLVLPWVACGPQSRIHVEDGCRVACCGCSGDHECDAPRRCWPLTINDETFHVCTASDEICLPEDLAKPLGPSVRTTRLSFLPRYGSEVLDFSTGTSTGALPTPWEGDVQLTEDGWLHTGFARAGGRPAHGGIADLGPVAALEDIAQAPPDGYEVAAHVVAGHAYAVRCQEGTYARCRVRQPIVESDGSLVGWLLEWSYQPAGGRDF